MKMQIEFPQVTFHNDEVCSFYTSLQRCLYDEFQLLFGVQRNTREDNRKLLSDRIVRGLGDFVNASLKTVTGFSIPEFLMNQITGFIHEKLTHREEKKSKFFVDFLSCRDDKSVENFTILWAHEAALVYSPAILYLSYRLQQLGLDRERVLAIFVFLGNVGALRAFEFFLNVDDLQLTEPTHVFDALLFGRSGSGYTGLFDNVLQYDGGLRTVKFTAEGFFRKVCFFYDQELFILRDNVDNTQADPTKMNPTYGFAQLTLTTYRCVIRRTLIKQSTLDRHCATGSPGSFILKTSFRFITLDVIINYLKYVTNNSTENITFVSWLHNTYPRLFPSNFPNRNEVMTPVFRGEIGGDIFKDIRFENGDFTGVDFSYSIFTNCTVRFNQARLIRCRFENVRFLAVSGAVLDYSSLLDCDLSNIALTLPLSLRYVTMVNTNLRGLTEGTFSKIGHEGAMIDNESRKTADNQPSISKSLFLENERAQQDAEKRITQVVELAKSEIQRMLENQQANQEKLESINENVEKMGLIATDQELLLNRVRNLELQLQSRTSSAHMKPRFLDITTILNEQSYSKEKWNQCVDQLLVSTRGEDGISGQSGSHGRSGVGNGGHGENGQDGTPGQDGRSATADIELTMGGIIDFENSKNLLYVRDDNGAIRNTLMVMTADTSIYLDASGGNGGYGGSGGNGGNGTDGKPGSNASQYSDGEDGGDGGDGGNGGRPGPGGRGGDARRVSVKVEAQQSYLLAFVKSVKVDGGKVGRNGEAGLGGREGAGGQGGQSYSWSETVGSGENQRTVTHFRAAGRQGKRGRRGQDSSSLNFNALSGSSGKVMYRLFNSDFTQANNYENVFNPQLCNAMLLGSGDFILEPGEELTIASLVLTNSSDMPTPPTGLSIGVVNDHLIQFNDFNRVRYHESILNGQNVTLPELSIRLRDSVIPARVPYYQKGTVNFRVYVEPVKVTMPKFDDGNRNKSLTEFESRFPIELSEPGYTQVLTSGYCIPIHFKIRNISAYNLGSTAALPRLVTLALLVDTNDADISDLGLFFNKTGSTEAFSLQANLIFNVETIVKESTLQVSGVIAMSERSQLPLYTQLGLRLQLQLGRSHTSDIQRVIQNITVPVQIGERFENHPSPELVLVVNSETSAECVNQWKALAAQLDMKAAVYNLSLYGYFDYFDPRFTNHLQGAIVVIFNNTFRHPLTGRSCCAYDLINRNDPLNAALLYSVKTYMIHFSKADWKSMLIISPFCTPAGDYTSRSEFLKADATQRILLKPTTLQIRGNKTLLFSKPKEEMITKKVTPFSQALKARYPDRAFAVGTKFQQELQGSRYLICKRYKVGELTLVSGTPLNSTHLAMSEQYPTSSFMFFKLMSFEQKLIRFERLLLHDGLSNDSSSLMANAILSDLADEFYVFANSLGAFNALLPRIINWPVFQGFVLKLSASSIGHDQMHDIIVAMDWLVTHGGGRPELLKVYQGWIDEHLMKAFTSSGREGFHRWKREQHQTINLPIEDRFSLLVDCCRCGGRAKVLAGMGGAIAWKRIRHFGIRNLSTNDDEKCLVDCDNWYLMENKEYEFSWTPEQKPHIPVNVEALRLASGSKSPSSSNELSSLLASVGNQAYFHLEKAPITHYQGNERKSLTSTNIRSADQQNLVQVIGFEE